MSINYAVETKCMSALKQYATMHVSSRIVYVMIVAIVLYLSAMK